MSGTEDRLIMTKFKDSSGSQLFCKAAFIVQALITIVFICGPIIGGFLNDAFGMHDSCLKMAIFGVVFLLLYTGASIYVYCTSYNDDMISLDDSIECDLNRSRGDELSRLLRTLTEDNRERTPLI